MKRVTNHYGKTEGQAWLYMPIVPATWEAKAEGKKKKKDGRNRETNIRQ
jgi:hypothetical protein